MRRLMPLECGGPGKRLPTDSSFRKLDIRKGVNLSDVAMFFGYAVSRSLCLAVRAWLMVDVLSLNRREATDHTIRISKEELTTSQASS